MEAEPFPIVLDVYCLIGSVRAWLLFDTSASLSYIASIVACFAHVSQTVFYFFTVTIHILTPVVMLTLRRRLEEKLRRRIYGDMSAETWSKLNFKPKPNAQSQQSSGAPSNGMTGLKNIGK